MTVTAKNLVPAKTVEATQTTQYIANGVTTIIDKFTATNTGLANVEFSVYLPASGFGATSANQVLKSRVIAPDETYLCPELVGQTLEANGYIVTNASLATLTISASGREIS